LRRYGANCCGPGNLHYSRPKAGSAAGRVRARPVFWSVINMRIHRHDPRFAFRKRKFGGEVTRWFGGCLARPASGRPRSRASRK
jgi:hypothetical protein